MSPAMGPPETMIWEYPMADDSWEVEFAEFFEDIQAKTPTSSRIARCACCIKDCGKNLQDSQIMIIVRSPLRISLGGGGTDLPSYYRDHSGFLIAAAIDKYVYITLHQTFAEELIIKYSKLERVENH